MTPAPIVIAHEGVHVVRDDLFPGGTKARFIDALWGDAAEVVYASPAEGGAQTALATVGARLGRRVTIFVAKRERPHDRALMAKALGATVRQIAPGYLTVVRKRAAEYCEATGARLLPFGLDVAGADDVIASAARATGLDPREVWCAAGSGLLARGLAQAWPRARIVCVQIGRDLAPGDVPGGAVCVRAPWRFEQQPRDRPPFPSDPHYDAKAWLMLIGQRPPADRAGIVFWNVTGPARAAG